MTTVSGQQNQDTT